MPNLLVLFARAPLASLSSGWIAVALILGLLILTGALGAAFHRCRKWIQGGWKTRICAAGSTLVIHLAVVVPFVRAIQAQASSDPETFRPNFTEAIGLYPHFAFFIVFFGWPILYLTWLASETVWKYGTRRGFVICAVILAVFGSAIVTYNDARGEAMMLFEFRKDVVADASPPVDPADAEAVKLASRILASGKAADLTDDRMRVIRRAFDYKSTWAKRSNWESPARPFYLLLLFYFSALMFYMSFIAPSFVTIRKADVSNEDRAAFSYFLIVAFAFITLWIPCRVLYNVSVKLPLFGVTPDSNTQIALATHGFTFSEVLTGGLALLFILSLTAFAIMKAGSSRLKLLVFASISLGVLAASLWLALSHGAGFATLVGVGAPLGGILARLFLITLLIFLGYWLVIGLNEPSPLPTLYISYKWEGLGNGARQPEIVESLCDALKKHGISYGIDNKVIRPGGSIVEFTRDLTRAPRVVAIISSGYLHSKHCLLYELYSIWTRCDHEKDEFQEKVIAMVSIDAIPALDQPSQIAEKWKSRLNTGDWTIEDKKKLARMIEDLPELCRALTAVLLPDARKFQEDGFQYVRDRMPIES